MKVSNAVECSSSVWKSYGDGYGDFRFIQLKWTNLFIEKVVILPFRVDRLLPPQLLPGEEICAAHSGVRCTFLRLTWKSELLNSTISSRTVELFPLSESSRLISWIWDRMMVPRNVHHFF